MNILKWGSYLDAKIDKVVHDCSDWVDISDSDNDECSKNIASDLSKINLE